MLHRISFSLAGARSRFPVPQQLLRFFFAPAKYVLNCDTVVLLRKRQARGSSLPDQVGYPDPVVGVAHQMEARYRLPPHFQFLHALQVASGILGQ